MPFGCPALDAIDNATAVRDEAYKALLRIAIRDRQSRVLPPGSRDDLALALAALENLHEMLTGDEGARPLVAALYQARIGK